MTFLAGSTLINAATACWTLLKSQKTVNDEFKRFVVIIPATVSAEYLGRNETIYLFI